MVSIWWVVWASLIGGFGGLMLSALMNMAAKQNDRTALADEAVQRIPLVRVNVEGSWRN